MTVPENLQNHPDVDDWIRMTPDGRVVVRTGKVDIGQRISTALALIAAEELDVDLQRVDVESVDTASSPDEEYSTGSNSVERSGPAIRLASATARQHLLNLAAKKLDVRPDSLGIVDGLVRSSKTNRSISYWELVPGGQFGIAVDAKARVKAPETYRQIGKRVTAIDLVRLVEGRERFVHDLVMPSMLHARLVRPPHYHARLAQIDQTIHERLGNAYLVRDGSFVAVAAEDEFEAVRLAVRVAGAIRWTSEPRLDDRDVFQRLVTEQSISLPVRNGEAFEEPVEPLGPPPSHAAHTVRTRIERPYVMHGSIGPSAALALFADGTLTIWTHTQGVYPLRTTIAEAVGMDPAHVRLVHRRGAGCYGHNGADDAAHEAALIARAIQDRPILLKWSREDEHAWEPYGPAMVVEVRASVDAAGRVIDWSHESWSDTHRTRPRPGPNRVGPARLLSTHLVSDPVPAFVPEPFLTAPLAGVHRNAWPIYTFPTKQVVKHLVRNMPLRTSTLRSLGSYTNVLAIESMMDQLAEASGIDAVEFRLRHLEDERARAVIEAVADRARWGNAPQDGSHGLGFARYNNLKAYAAVVVDLKVDDAANIRLRRIVVAADAGQIVDTDGLALQLEGAALQSASWTLYERVTFDSNGITSRDWQSYPILRFDNIPEVETVLIDRPELPSLGPSECAVGPTAAAIANALYRATGLRPSRLPFTPETIRAEALRQ